ncbi:hypothetical protein GCM10010345_60700 [Streptomyces canarius]|uniref:Uncharacterized protein n=1 Tax=Streptomyces canarius TaxID=285453 RepID=A0ABQ3CYX0_9ACTN|nr:hypothetical protein GCM10010345_60700 [Streptomyces canarius]
MVAELLPGLLHCAGRDGDPQERLGADAQPGQIDFGREPEHLATHQRLHPAAGGERGGADAPREVGAGRSPVPGQGPDQLVVEGLEDGTGGCRGRVRAQLGQFGLRQQAAAPVEDGR